MNKRIEYGWVAVAAFVASLIAGAIVPLIFTLSFSAQSEPELAISVLPFALLLGVLTAMLTAWPLGWLIGCLMLRFGKLTGRNAALAGAMTGAALILAAYSETVIESPNELRVALPFAVGFVLLGALSGLIAYRVVLMPKPDEE